MAAPKGNRYAVGNHGGHPPIYATPEDMAKSIDEYFEWAEGEYKEKTVMIQVAGGGMEPQRDEFGDPVVIRKCIRPPEVITINGLALFLGFAGRNSMMDSEKRKEQGEVFSQLLAWARARVEMDYENRLANRDKSHGAQFALMNMGWAANTRHGVVDKNNELVDPPKQVMIINGKEIQF